jgi:hypothetical protein
MAFGMTLQGALFFVTNSVRQKRDSREPYDPRKFWGGLWYRTGEAILFTVAFVFVLRYGPGKPAEDGGLVGDQWLPLVGLFLGMFVKSGEALIFGLAQRVLQAASGLVGQAEVAVSVADEVARLADLRAKGLLSEEEFQRQKERLLRQ